MTDLERYEERDAWIPVRQDIGELAKQLAGTPFVGAFRGKPADVFGAILYGHELRLPPLQALQALDSIDGKPTLKSEALRALFFREGHRLEVVHWDAKACTVRAERRDGLSSVEVTYSMGDAQAAGLTNKKNWRTSPKQMLHARATAMAIRAVAPDIALGIDMTDEAEPAVRPAAALPTVVQVAPLIDVRPEPEPMPAPEEPEVVDGVVVEDEPLTVAEPAVDPPADLVTPGQMRLIGALIGEWESHEGRKLGRDERRRFIGFMAGVPDPDSLVSAKDLTKAQASQAIEELRAAVELAEAQAATGELPLPVEDPQ